MAVGDADLDPQLRHTHAALLIRDGANPLAIQKRLGHKDIRTTLNVYGHLLPEQDETLSGRLDATDREARASQIRPKAAVVRPLGGRDMP